MADASDRIREHRERKEKLEVAAEEARALLAERRQLLNSADTIATFAFEMSESLKTSELTETPSLWSSQARPPSSTPSPFLNRRQKLRYSWAVDLDATSGDGRIS